MEHPTDAMRRKLAEQHDEIAWLKERLEESEHGRSVAWDRTRFAERERDELRQLVRDVVLLAGVNGCDVTKMQLHAHGGDWRTVWERIAELGVPGTEADND